MAVPVPALAAAAGSGRKAPDCGTAWVEQGAVPLDVEGEHRSACHQKRVKAGQGLRQCGGGCGQEAREQGMLLGKGGAMAGRRGVCRHPSPLGQGDRSVPAAACVHLVPDH